MKNLIICILVFVIFVICFIISIGNNTFNPSKSALVITEIVSAGADCRYSANSFPNSISDNYISFTIRTACGVYKIGDNIILEKAVSK